MLQIVWRGEIERRHELVADRVRGHGGPGVACTRFGSLLHFLPVALPGRRHVETDPGGRGCSGTICIIIVSKILMVRRLVRGGLLVVNRNHGCNLEAFWLRRVKLNIGCIGSIGNILVGIAPLISLKWLQTFKSINIT